MKESALDLYIQQMYEIRKRDEVIVNITSHRCTTGFQYSDLEICMLQLRKTIELIAMGSIISNVDEYSKMNEKYYDNWNARLVFQDVERINPLFYPQPISINHHNDGPDEFIALKSEYMTKDEAIKLYEKCGAFLHANNPYKNPVDFEYYRNNIDSWRSKIVRLLNVHLIKLLDGNMYYVVMNDKSTGYPSGNICEKSM